MKIYARGAYRHRGTKKLAEAQLEENTSPDRLWYWPNWPHWDETRHELAVRIKGTEDLTTHQYEVVFSVEDLAFMLLAAFQRGSKDEAAGIHARAIAAYIREALSSKRKTKQQTRAKKKRTRKSAQ